MKKAEAIEYIKKNCYGEWCEDDWREAMDMAIEALKSSERTAETSQIDHIAESDRKVSISCAHENDGGGVVHDSNLHSEQASGLELRRHIEALCN